MDRSSGPVLVLAAVFLLSAFAVVPHPAAAQVGTSSLAGSVCSLDNQVVYIRAPDEGDTAGCGGIVPGATLRLTKPGLAGTAVTAADLRATSDQNGSYQFNTIGDGDYTLTVTRTGFDTATLNVTVSGATRRDVGLHPQVVSVPGRVIDTNGAPIAFAMVTACCGPQTGSANAVTDGAGDFRLKTEAGMRTFTVEKDGRFLASDTRFVDGNQNVALTVPPPPRPDATLRGTVTDQDGKPLAGVTVNVYSNGCCYSPEPMPVESDGGNGSSGSASSGTATASPAIARPCCYGGGSNATTTDGAGRYSMRIFGGSGVSVSVYRDGYASFNKYFEVKPDEDRVLDVKLLKFPAKTAHVEGKIIDAATGKALPYVTLSLQSPAYGLYECSSDGSSGGVEPMPAPAMEGASDKAMPMPAYNGCAITIRPDGTFSGNVTPGYAIVQAYYDAWRACPPKEGAAFQPCAPEYYAWTRSLTLASGTTQLTVALEQRPAPDAVVSGYVLDDASGKPIPNAQVSFSNDDAYGYGSATTDQDGSYRIRLRSGHLTVYAYAEGHLHWQGTLAVAAGETPFDVRLTAGEESNGGGCCCCYAYDKGVAVAASSGPGSYTSSGTSAPQAAGSEAGSASAFEDLHGGLGPYDAAARARALDKASGHASPGAGLFALLALLGCAALLRRR